MTSALSRSLESVLKNIQLNDVLPLDGNVPVEPSQFCSSFGYLSNPRIRWPVTELADYQPKVWKAVPEYKRVLVVESKSGLQE